MPEYALDAVPETVHAVGVMRVVRVRAARAHVVVVRVEVLRAVGMMLGGLLWWWWWWWGGGRMLGEGGGEAEFAEACFDSLAGMDGLGFGGAHFAHHVGDDAAEERRALLAAVADGGRAQRHARDGELRRFLGLVGMSMIRADLIELGCVVGEGKTYFAIGLLVHLDGHDGNFDHLAVDGQDLELGLQDLDLGILQLLLLHEFEAVTEGQLPIVTLPKLLVQRNSLVDARIQLELLRSWQGRSVSRDGVNG